MKTLIFDQTKEWPPKVNFIDSNNVLLGYDMDRYCCEHAEWGLFYDEECTSKFEVGETEGKILELEGYYFDVGYFREIEWDGDIAHAIFRLAPDSKYEFTGERMNKTEMPALYIRLSNAHTGYYDHGFTSHAKPTREGQL